jgi:EAL domain-containing protein (putative c-di-GMP-specific phosphodiesterase class I)
MQRCLDGAVDHGIRLASICQPIGSLTGDAIVGFGARTRWPQLDNPTPGDVFVRALAAGRLSSLNRMCVDSAMDAALAAGLPPHALLVIDNQAGGRYRGLSDRAVQAREQYGFRLVYELTERNLLEHPRGLLDMVAALRADGIAIALNGVGVQPESQVLLDILEPEIVKLDPALMQPRLPRERLRAVNAVREHRERTGAVILADGIETDDQLQRMLELGATLGQGARFGHPGPFAIAEPAATPIPNRPPRYGAATASPFSIAAAAVPLRRGDESTMVQLTRDLESRAEKMREPQIVLAVFQGGRHFTESARRRYESFAASASLVCAFGDIPAEPGRGVRWIVVDRADPLSAEWAVLTLGVHAAAAVVGRASADTAERAGAELHFDIAVTTQRSAVTAIARDLLGRIK